MNKPLAYYNEIDRAAAHVLRALIDANVIAPGVVDTRSIKEVHPDDLNGFTQCHFFAGGGLWSVAARLAGWPDARPLWTASCPCQPFSVAGKGAGTDDPRHLWPDLYRLASARRPAVLVGEQVAGKAGDDWLDGIGADLAAEGFAFGAVEVPACSVDAPHQRARNWWASLADCQSQYGGGRPTGQEDGRIFANVLARSLEHSESVRWGEGQPEPELRSGRGTAASADAQGTLGNSIGARLEGYAGHGDASRGSVAPGSIAAPDGRDMGDGPSFGRQQGEPSAAPARHGDQPASTHGRNGSNWSDHEWIICHDDKARRTKPGLRLLVDGFPGRVDIWRIAGNAIVPQVAAEILESLMDVLPEWRAAP